MANKYWAGRTDRSYAYGELLAAGATLEFGSDAPVSALDPWLGIASAVFRTVGERAPWHPEQAIGLDDALATADVTATMAAGRWTHRTSADQAV